MKAVVQTYPAVSVEELAFAMSVFVSAAHSGFASNSLPPLTHAETLQCRLVFLRLSGAMSSNLDSIPLPEQKQQSMFRVFLTLWGQYRGVLNGAAVCARVLSFCLLMENSRGTVIEDWVLPALDGSETVTLHPAVVACLAYIPLSSAGALSAVTFRKEVARLVSTYPEQVSDAEAVCSA